jgi:hypothetical protein
MGRAIGRTYEETKQPGTGATVDPRTGESLSKGWAVAVPGHEQLVPSEQYSPEALRSYAQQHREALSRPGRHLGVWHEPGAGAFLDVSEVHPETYEGGVRAIAGAYRGAEGLRGPRHQEQGIYRMGTGQTLYTHPGTPEERRETGQAMKGLRKQQPRAKKVADMPTKALGAAIRNRRPA